MIFDWLKRVAISKVLGEHALKLEYYVFTIQMNDAYQFLVWIPFNLQLGCWHLQCGQKTFDKSRKSKAVYKIQILYRRPSKKVQILKLSSILVSIVVSIPACHAGDQGSIPWRGEFLSVGPCFNVTITFSRHEIGLTSCPERFLHISLFIFVILKLQELVYLFKVWSRDVSYCRCFKTYLLNVV